MTLITKGMGAIIKGALKKGTKSIKQGITAPKTNKPFYAAAAIALAQKLAREKLKSKKKKKDKE